MFLSLAKEIAILWPMKFDKNCDILFFVFWKRPFTTFKHCLVYVMESLCEYKFHKLWFKKVLVQHILSTDWWVLEIKEQQLNCQLYMTWDLHMKVYILNQNTIIVGHAQTQSLLHVIQVRSHQSVAN